MNENLLRRIKRQLNAKFYMMNDAWLRDCIGFYVGDNIHEKTDKDIFKFVKGQWQLSDLREISNENGCLPRNLVQQTHTVLTSTYILQVDKMYDIASSKYKQLCEIRKINNENLEMTEKEKEEKEWQPKGRRMMQLCLTDGVQDVTAIEYTPLKEITGALLPGYKVMIIGPVDCRRGIILLEDGKYKEVGGEVESMLKSNASENVFARALGILENPDPYNDNKPCRIMNQNTQSVASYSNNNDSFFDDDFAEDIDLEAVTEIERQKNQEAVQKRFESISDCRQMASRETNEMEEMADIDFECFENWSSDSLTKPSRILPRTEIEETDEKDNIMIIEEASTSTHDFGKSVPSTSSLKNQNFVEFPDDDFDFDDDDIIMKTNESESRQDKNPLKNKIETRPPLMSTLKSINFNANFNPKEVKKCISTKAVKVVQNENSVIFKICDILSDVLCKPIMGKIYKTVRGQVKSYSPLTKQNKCWWITALIADHTSSVEVCFNSEILEEFLGYTVREFSQKKKLAKSDPQVDNELRLRLRKAQYEIQNLDGLLKLELAQDEIPKVVGIRQLTAQQKKDYEETCMKS